MTSRRQFLAASLAAGAGLSAARGIEPIRRPDNSLIKLSLAGYSFNKYMSLKGMSKPAMSLDDFADFAAGLGIGAIEPTAYYFPETTSPYLTRFRGRCTRLGLDISGTAIGNDFCKVDPGELKKQIASTKEWIEHAALIGAKTIRIFAGSLAKGDTEEAARGRCVEAIQEACDHAAKYGIYLALENHGGIVATAEQMLAVVKAVQHDWFGVNLDTANFHSDDPYADLAKIAPYAVVVQIKTEIHPKGQGTQPADLKRLLDILRAAHFRGYVALEYEAAEDPRTAVPKAIAELQKLI
jgi:sugar phosphate isomerase/epimerase